MSACRMPLFSPKESAECQKLHPQKMRPEPLCSSMCLPLAKGRFVKPLSLRRDCRCPLFNCFQRSNMDTVITIDLFLVGDVATQCKSASRAAGTQHLHTSRHACSAHGAAAAWCGCCPGGCLRIISGVGTLQRVLQASHSLCGRLVLPGPAENSKRTTLDWPQCNVSCFAANG